MSGDQKRQLEQKLWAIANERRGKMHADEFRDYILGFIFYKYLSERQELFARELLKTEKTKQYRKLTDKASLAAIREESLETLGDFLEPEQLFSVLAAKGNSKVASEDGVEAASSYILEELDAVLTHIEQSTMGTESEEDFTALFEDLDLHATKLGRSVSARNELIAKVLVHLDGIDFKLEDANADVLGDAYEYLIGQFAAGAGKKAGEFIHPFEDGNGRMGRLWQTLMLAQWNPRFELLPVESLVHAHQPAYYAALNLSNQQGASTPFVEFMLGIIHETVATTQKTTQDTTQESSGYRILVHLLSNPKATRASVARALGDITPDGVKYHLAKLQKEGRLLRVGPTKGGHWEVLGSREDHT